MNLKPNDVPAALQQALDGDMEIQLLFSHLLITSPTAENLTLIRIIRGSSFASTTTNNAATLENRLNDCINSKQKSLKQLLDDVAYFNNQASKIEIEYRLLSKSISVSTLIQEFSACAFITNNDDVTLTINPCINPEDDKLSFKYNSDGVNWLNNLYKTTSEQLRRDQNSARSNTKFLSSLNTALTSAAQVATKVLTFGM